MNTTDNSNTDTSTNTNNTETFLHVNAQWQNQKQNMTENIHPGNSGLSDTSQLSTSQQRDNRILRLVKSLEFCDKWRDEWRHEGYLEFYNTAHHPLSRWRWLS